MENKPYDTASEVTAEDGEVIMDGPNGHTYSFTPDAALETSERLLEAGMTANGQAVQAKRKSQGRDRP